MSVVHGVTKSQINEGLNDWDQRFCRYFLEVHNIKNGMVESNSWHN